MSAVHAPRLAGGFAASVVFHAAVVGALELLLQRSAPAPAPPIYSVHILAAPPGERIAGIVHAPATVPPNQLLARVPVRTRELPVPSTRRRVTKPNPVPTLVTPAPRTKAPPAAAVAAPPAAAGGPTGGKGADVANIDTPGIEFDFPPYTNNIVSQLVRRFGPMQGSLSATVRFVIRRDGSVDLESIKIVEPSGNYPFDQRAEGAVESAANARAFGPLPSAFREDILLVRFRFSPSAIR
jgi:outer membrane biosynthesis protein TonB